jgi:hypothetical protein
MIETKTIDNTGFYSDKIETPKEVIKLSEKLKNMEPKSNAKINGKSEELEKVNKFEVILEKKSTKNNVDHWIKIGNNKKVFHFGRLSVYGYIANSLNLGDNDKLKVKLERA